ncbi:GatB/YqeY domain-containing protein [Halanaerobaculum tunisiense]
MSIQDQLLADMKEAMKNQQKDRLSVIRQARAEIKDAEISEGKDLSEEELIKVLSKLVKQTKESLAEFEKAGDEERIAQAKQEIEILQEYLPEQLSDEELVDLVEETIAEVGAQDMSDMGQVMGAIMPQVRGKADGDQVNKLVRERLQ